MGEAAAFAEDRSMAVPAGSVVRTGYVRIDRVRLACRARMAVGDVERAMRRQLQLGERQAWPCPNGAWDGETFVIADGRHAYVAALMLGLDWLLVAWIEAAAALPPATSEAAAA